MYKAMLFCRLYSCLANGSSDEFQRGEHYVRGKCVNNVLQIGFHLCGNVLPPATSINKVNRKSLR